MKSPKKRNSATAIATFLLSSILGPQSYGGAITSANAPPPPPPTIIPGVIRLTCSLQLSSWHEVLGSSETSRGNSAETYLDYEKAEGASDFKCVEGCDTIVWERNRSEWPAGEIKPVSKVTLIGQIGLPSLHLKIIGSQMFLETRVQSAHRSWTGSIISNKNDSLVPFTGREFYAESRTDESIDTARVEDLKQLALETKRTVVSSARTVNTLRCTVIQPGQRSKAQIAKVLATPPRTGTISAKEYEKATSIEHISQPYTKVLELARKIDPDHRKAMIANFAILRRDIDFLKPLAAKVRDAVKTHPNMTAENAWSYVAQLLGINPMSPSGVVIPPMVPLMIVELENAESGAGAK